VVPQTVKIASQRLPSVTRPNLHALCELSAESQRFLESSTYKSLFPHHRFSISLFSYSYKSLFPQLPYFHIYTKRPGVLPAAYPACKPVNRTQTYYFHTIANSWSSLKKSTPLKSSKSRLFPQNTRGGVPTTFFLTGQVRSSIPVRPKWSIIPAPVSPARPRGRSE
jgi:hypothetical protein